MQNMCVFLGRPIHRGLFTCLTYRSSSLIFIGLNALIRSADGAQLLPDLGPLRSRDSRDSGRAPRLRCRASWGTLRIEILYSLFLLNFLQPILHYNKSAGKSVRGITCWSMSIFLCLLYNPRTENTRLTAGGLGNPWFVVAKLRSLQWYKQIASCYY